MTQPSDKFKNLLFQYAVALAAYHRGRHDIGHIVDSAHDALVAYVVELEGPKDKAKGQANGG